MLKYNQCRQDKQLATVLVATDRIAAARLRIWLSVEYTDRRHVSANTQSTEHE